MIELFDWTGFWIMVYGFSTAIIGYWRGYRDARADSHVDS